MCMEVMDHKRDPQGSVGAQPELNVNILRPLHIPHLLCKIVKPHLPLTIQYLYPRCDIQQEGNGSFGTFTIFTECVGP